MAKRFSPKCYSLAMSRTAAICILMMAAHGCTKAQGNTETLFEGFLRANSHLGLRLLKEVQASAPNRNTAISPLPVTMVLATIEHNVGARGDIMQAFGSQEDFSEA